MIVRRMRELARWMAPLVLLGAAVPVGAQAHLMLHGGGATFPFPLYAQWSYEYARLTGERFNYQSIGSGAGIEQMRHHIFDFGASEAPLDADVLSRSGLIQFPMVIGGVVPVVNLPGIASAELKLTGPILADVFLGRITSWRDPRIMALNPHLRLPPLEISVVTRADGSGSTWLITRYLGEVSADWRLKVGNGPSVRWPVGMASKGNEGVSSYVKQTTGSIGYVEFTYARQNGLATVLLQNRAGGFPSPGRASFLAAAAKAEWSGPDRTPRGLTDQAGEDSWPIVGASFILIARDQPDGKRAEALLKYFDWCFRGGKRIVDELDYVPIPEPIVRRIEASWAAEIRSAGKPVWPLAYPAAKSGG